MKNYYMLRRISENDIPDKHMFETFDDYPGTCQMQETVNEDIIFICTDGSEIESEELIVDLSTMVEYSGDVNYDE